ncbi:MAG: leucine-rich repeat domain-containing protein [Puniceicoccaceae bacterium]
MNALPVLQNKRLLAFLVLLVAGLQASLAQVIFEDPALEDRVRDTLGIADGPITETDMLQLETLVAVYENIDSLVGLEAATNLTRIHLSYNNVMDLSPIGNLQNLTFLDLDHNQISDLEPIINLPVLDTLDLANNPLSDISALPALTSLTNLNISYTDVANPGYLLEMSNLTYLYVAGLGLTDTGALANLFDLTYLDLSDNPVGDLYHLLNLTKLDSLRLNNCGLTDLGILVYIANLSALYLADNQLTDISLVAEYMPNLTRLNLSGNQISDFSILDNLRDLTSLYLSRTAIDDLSPLQNLTALRTLHLVDNDLTDIAPLTGLTQLRNLRLRNNHIADLTAVSNLTQLTYLDLRENEITSIEPLTLLTSLRSLYLGWNQIRYLTGINHDMSSTLRTLTLNDNNILNVSSLASISSLVTLQLQNNEIQSIAPLADLPNLATLNLNENPISEIPDLACFPIIRNLYLRNLPLTDFSFLSVLSSVSQLDLSGTGFSQYSLLASIPSLNSLWIRNNGISNLTPIVTYTDLSLLDISENPVSDLAPLLSLSRLESLYLAETGLKFADLLDFTHLKSIALVGNGISDLSLVSLFTELQWIYLRDNFISDLSPLTEMNNLTHVYVQSNRITDISNVANWTGIEALDLQENFIDFSGDPTQAAALASLENSNPSATIVSEPQYPVDTPTLVSYSELPEIIEGDEVVLSVDAVSFTDLTYAWYFGESLLEGEGEDTLVLSEIQLSDAGTYKVVITDANASIEHSFDVTIDPEKTLTVNIRDGLGAWKAWADHDAWRYSGYTERRLNNRMYIAEIEFQHLPGFWTPKVEFYLMPGENIYDAAYVTDPDYRLVAGDLELLSGGMDIRTEVRGGSSDGSVVTGNFHERYWTPTIWTPDDGLQPAPTLPDASPSGTFVTTQDATAEGSIVVGRGFDETGNLLPIVWYKEGDAYTPVYLPLPPNADPNIYSGRTLGRAIAVNEAGTIICGTVLREGAIWTWNAQTASWNMPVLTGVGEWDNAGSFRLPDVWLYDVSEDGSVAAGFVFLYDEYHNPSQRPLYWKDNLLSALPIPEGTESCEATAISADGTMIVGSYRTGDNSGLMIWTWSGDLNAYQQQLVSLSPDYGSVDQSRFLNRESRTVVFTAYQSAGLHWEGMMWDEVNGIVRVDEWLWETFGIDFGTDWTPRLTYADPAKGLAYGSISTLWDLDDRQGFYLQVQPNIQFAELTVNLNTTGSPEFQWRVEGGQWQDVGQAVRVPAGEIIVEFTDTLGYTPIADQRISLVEGASATLEVTTVPTDSVGNVDPLLSDLLPNLVGAFYRAMTGPDGSVWLSSGFVIDSGFGDELTGPLLRADPVTGLPDPGFSLQAELASALILDTFEDGSALVVAGKGLGQKQSILKILPTGELDPVFQPYPVDLVRMAKVLSDGSIVVGEVREPNTDAEIGYIVNLFPNGMPNPNWYTTTLEERADPGRYGPAVWGRFLEDDEGFIYVAGSFDHVNGFPEPGLIRLYSSGSVDYSFNPEIQRVNNYYVRSIGLQSDGKLLIGPQLTDSFGELPDYYPIVRLNHNGSFDWSFNRDAAVSVMRDRDPRDMIVLLDDSYIVTGSGGTHAFLPDGTLDTTRTFATAEVTIQEDFSLTDYHFFIDELSDGYVISGTVVSAGYDYVSYVGQSPFYGAMKVDLNGNFLPSFAPPRPFMMSFPESVIPMAADTILLHGAVEPYDRMGSLEVESPIAIDLQSGSFEAFDPLSQLPVGPIFSGWLDFAGTQDGWYALYEEQRDTIPTMVLAGFTGSSYTGERFAMPTVSEIEDNAIFLKNDQLAIVGTRVIGSSSLDLFDGDYVPVEIWWTLDGAVPQHTEIARPVFYTGIDEGTIGEGHKQLWHIDPLNRLLVSIPDANGYPVLARYNADGSIDGTFTPLAFTNSGEVSTFSIDVYYPPGTIETNESTAAIHAVIPLPNGGYAIGGRFEAVHSCPEFLSQANAEPPSRRSIVQENSPLIVVDKHGWVDPAHPAPVLALDPDMDPTTLAVHDIVPMNGFLYILGNFDFYDGAQVDGIARLFENSLRLDPRFSVNLEYKDYDTEEVISRGHPLPSGDLLLTGQFGPPDASFPSPLNLIRVTEEDLTTVQFRDSNLRAAVEDALDIYPGMPINLTSLEMLTSLDASNRNIADLEGIQWAANLFTLTLDNNDLTEISPLVGLTGLDSLDLRYNFLDIADGSGDRTVIDTLAIATAVLYDPQKGGMQTYADWVTAMGIPPEHSGPNDIVGPAWLPNLLAFGMGMDPFTATSADEPLGSMNPDQTLSYVFTRDLATHGIETWFEFSTDFINWTPIVPVQMNFIEELQDGTHNVEAVFEFDMPEILLRYRVQER